MSARMQNSDTVMEDLATAYVHLVATRCMTFAGFTVLVYDHLATFPEEVAEIWSRPKNVVSIMFLLNRYSTPLVLMVDLYDKSGLASSLTRPFCRVWLLAEGFLTVLSFSIIHALVALRVSALYGQNPWVVALLSIAFVAYNAVTLTLAGIGLVPMSLDQSISPFNICSAPVSQGLWIIWLPSLFFESFMVILTVVRVFRYIGPGISISTPVAYLLYRDGILYFLVMGTSSLLCLLDWTVAPPTLSAMAQYFCHAVCVCASSKLVLNLRGLGPSCEVWTTSCEFSQAYESRIMTSLEVYHPGTATRSPSPPIEYSLPEGVLLHSPPIDTGLGLYSDICQCSCSTSPRSSTQELPDDITNTHLNYHLPLRPDWSVV